jgi:type I restriction enzyme S subunit
MNLKSGQKNTILNLKEGCKMALKITTTYLSEFDSNKRIEPKYYLFIHKFHEFKNKYSFEKLGDLSDNIFRGQSPKPSTYLDKKENNFVFIRTADVKKYQINFQTVVYLNKEVFQTQKRNRIKAGDILISVVGNYLGSTAVIPRNINEGAFNDNSARIRIIKKNWSNYFISYFLNSTFGQRQINSLLTRTGQKILSAGNVKKLEIPSVEFQWEIDKKASQIEEKELKAINLLEQSQQLFYEKLNIDFSKIEKKKFYSVNLSDFKDADLWTPKYSYPLYIDTLKAIKQKWQTVPIGEIATVKKGDEVGSKNYNKYLDKKDSDIPFIRTSDLVNYEVDQFPDFYIPKEIYEELNQDIKAGDVLFTKDGKIGMTAMITESDKAIIASGLVRLRLKKESKKYHITPEYLFMVLSLKETGLYPALRRTVTASTIPHLREERLKEIEIPILDKESIDEITKLVKYAFKLKDEKKKLIQEVRREIDSCFNM